MIVAKLWRHSWKYCCANLQWKVLKRGICLKMFKFPQRWQRCHVAVVVPLIMTYHHVDNESEQLAQSMWLILKPKPWCADFLSRISSPFLAHLFIDHARAWSAVQFSIHTQPFQPQVSGRWLRNPSRVSEEGDPKTTKYLTQCHLHAALEETWYYFLR